MALSVERVKDGGAVVRITVAEDQLVFFGMLSDQPQGPGGNKFTDEVKAQFILQKLLQNAVEQMNDAVQGQQAKDADLDKQAEAQHAEIDKRVVKLKGARPELIGFEAAAPVVIEAVK